MNRVEALVRITSAGHLRELDELFTLAMSEETSSWWLEADGTWTRHSTAEDGSQLDDMQNVLMREISQRRRPALR